MPSVESVLEAVEKVFFLSLRAKRGNLAFNKISGLEIASSQELLLAMTCDEFFNKLLVLFLLLFSQWY